MNFNFLLVPSRRVFPGKNPSKGPGAKWLETAILLTSQALTRAVPFLFT